MEDIKSIRKDAWRDAALVRLLVDVCSCLQLDIRTKHSSYGSYYLLNKKDAEIMSQMCALSTEQLWHRYQPCALREKALLGKRKSMLLCLHYSCDQNYLFFKKPLYAANNSLLPVQTRGARNKRLSSRHGNRGVWNESSSSDGTAHDLHSDGNWGGSQVMPFPCCMNHSLNGNLSRKT